MRAVPFCFVSSAAALASAVALLAPGDSTDPDALRPRPAPAGSARHQTVSPTPALELPRPRALAPTLDPAPEVLAPAPILDSAAGTNAGPPTNPSGPQRDAEIARLETELCLVRSRLQDAERRLARLVQEHCRERFDFELEQWLAGSVDWLCVYDSQMLERVRDALVASAEEHARDRIWDPDLQEWYAGECPEAVDELRARIPDALVAQLVGQFRDWDREKSRLPRIEYTGGCGVSRDARTVRVARDGQELLFRRDDPYLRSLLDERDSVDRQWQRRINRLLDAEVYELD